MSRLGTLALVCFVLYALLGLVLGCGAGEPSDETQPDRGNYGARVDDEVGRLALESFLGSTTTRAASA